MGRRKADCKTCIYRAKPSAAWKCDYCAITGRTRMAVPANKCKCYEEGDRLQEEVRKAEYNVAFSDERIEPKEKKEPHRTDRARSGRPILIDRGKMLELYQSGMNDREIAETMGCTHEMVYRWRKANGLKTQAKRCDWEKAKELYAAGATDEEVAKAIGCTLDGVRKWKKRNKQREEKAKEQGIRTYEWEIAEKLYKEGKTDREIGEAMRCDPKRVNNWRRRNHLPVHEAGHVKLDWTPARGYYDAGYSDPEIARAMHCSTPSVKEWRKREGLERNPDRRNRR